MLLAFLQNAPLYIVPFLLVVTVIVTIHELGHFLTARAFGVAVDRFSIGFGPTLWARRDKSGVEWRVAALPIGGYVRFAGDDNAASIPDSENLEEMRAHIVAREGQGAELKYIHFKPLWQRALIVAAGPIANFVLAVALFILVLGIFGEQVGSTRISRIEPGTPAAKAGFQVGDVVRRIDGQSISNFEDFSVYVKVRAGVPVDVQVERAGRLIDIVATPTSVVQPNISGGTQTVGRMGIWSGEVKVVRHGPIGTVVLAVKCTYQLASSTLYYLGRMITGGVRADQLGSMIGTAHAAGDLTKQAIAAAHTEHVNVVVAVATTLVQLIAFMSVSVGLLNLMPVPVLDGGHLLFYAYESVARRPLSAGVQAASYRVGLALLLCLMLFATWNDLQRLRVFHFLGGLIS